MGDVRFDEPFERLRAAPDRARALRGLSSEDVIAALAASGHDPLLANVLATEAQNRMRRATTIARVIGEGVLLLSSEGRVRFLNPAAQELLGADAGALEGRPLHEILHPQRAICGQPTCPLEQMLTTDGARPPTTHRIARLDGDLREFSIAVYPVDEGDSHPSRVVTLRDVSELARTADLLRQRVDLLENVVKRALDEIERRRITEQDLRENERRLAEIVGTIGEGIVILAADGQVLFSNRAARQIMATRGEGPPGDFRDASAWRALEESGEGARVERALEDVLRGGSRAEFEVRVPDAEGRIKTLAVEAVPLRDARGTITSALITFADITRRAAAEQRLVELNRELEVRVARRTRDLARVNEELEAFTRAATHDLKAPLRRIALLAGTLTEDSAAGRGDDAAGTIARLKREASHATRLVDDLLALAQAGRTDIRRQDVDLSALAAATVSRFREWDPEREVDVNIETGLVAYADPGLLGTLVENILGNAWKYTGRRSDARIEVGALSAEPDAFFVRDNGIGFDPSDAALLFEPFRRLPSAAAFEGTGIGLATVARIVERHGGRVWATGAPGKGATFCFTLPRERR